MPLWVKFLLASLFVFVLFVASLLWYLDHQEQRQMTRMLRHHSELILNFATGSRQYVKQVLRPALDERTDDFILEGKSSTFATHGIFHYPCERFKPPPLGGQLSAQICRSMGEGVALEPYGGNREISLRQSYCVRH